MEEISIDFDEAAGRKVTRIERLLRKADPAAEGAFASIANALEYQFEISARDAETVRLLARALKAFAESRGIDLESTGVAKPLKSLLDYAPSG
jgi:hypothetical protein